MQVWPILNILIIVSFFSSIVPVGCYGNIFGLISFSFVISYLVRPMVFPNSAGRACNYNYSYMKIIFYT